SVVQHSRTSRSPCTEPARWSYIQTPSKPSPSAAIAPSRTSRHVVPNGSKSRSICTPLILASLKDDYKLYHVEESGRRRIELPQAARLAIEVSVDNRRCGLDE